MPTMNDIGIPGLGQGVFAVKHKNRWRLRFIGIGKVLGANGVDLSLNMESFTKPNVSFDEITLHRYNSTVKVPSGKGSIGDVSFTAMDDMTGLASDVIQAQIDAQQRLTGSSLDQRYLAAAATASDIKFGILFEQLDGSDKVVETWRLGGCWLKSFNAGEVSYADGSGYVQINCDISVDTVSWSRDGAGYGSSLGGGI